MALTLYTNVSGTITQLNDGNPFKLESAEGLSGSDVIRYEQGGPFQNGATDLGFRFQPRVMTLSLLFYASTATLLDTYRATLMAAFKPLDSTSIFLSVLRDDSEIRVLTCFTVGDIAIELVPENYPGHLHRATVSLRAATPLWRANDATLGTVSWSAGGSWWLAGGAIAAANVKAHDEYPPQDDAGNALGTITGDWAVALFTSKETVGAGSSRFAFADSTGGSASFWKTTADLYAIYDTDAGTTWPGTTGYNYHVIESRSGTQVWRYWTGGSITAYRSVAVDYSLRTGSNFTWRGHRSFAGSVWSPDLRKAAVYGTVTINQLQALGAYMFDVGGTINLVNDGDVYAYPIINIYGPITNPVIVNTTTSSTIDLTGLSLSASQVATLDLRDGNKQLYNQAGATLFGSVTTFPMGIASFSLAPAPIAAGGTNTITVTPGTAGTAAYMTVQITNQYMSF